MCQRCKEPYEREEGKKERWQNHCPECTRVRRQSYTRQRALIHCTGCRRDRPERMFRRGDLLAQQCEKCRKEETYKIQEAKADIEYDYRWARFTGKSHFEALHWLADGYKVGWKSLRDTLPHL